jgi:two-component system sensor histidine kinase YesM
MRNWWRQWRFSIFTKIVLIFLIVISPLYVFGAQINEWGAEIVKNEISKSLRSQIEFYSSSLEKEIDRMIRLQREYVNDDDLLALSLTVDSMSDFQRAEAIKRFQIRLGLMKQSSIYVDKATAYIPLMSRSISTVELSTILEQATVDLLKQTMQKSNSPLIQLGDRLYLRDYYPSLYIRNQPYCVIYSSCQAMSVAERPW